MQRPPIFSPTLQSLPSLQEDDDELWVTDDEFDHPCGPWRVQADVGCPSGNVVWAGPGCVQSAADAWPPSLPRGASLPLGVAGAAPAGSPTRPGPSTPPRFAAGAGLAGGRPGEWSQQANGPSRRGGGAGPRSTASGVRAGASSSSAARAGGEQEADLVHWELQRSELAGSVPAPTEEAAPSAPGAPAITTLMISGLPMALTQRDLLGLIDQTGFADCYDFAYMPTDFDAGTTMGHAFVNFVTPYDAREFSIQWNGSRLTRVARDNTIATVLEVKESAKQGYAENARRWKASRLRRFKNPDFRPFFAQGRAAQ
ncbi:unnamed protein product [Prorocentrum cordatum]|uniref:RRM domain-containing protein n=1 Tax=Prorocentrum cordatum TaxID=2364126 RepID=A0ABN9W8S4_9DINO|nr:unnamed protein product [Polarella glacialis]